MVSILLAQYVHATQSSTQSEGSRKAGQRIATVLFLGSNLVLALVHLKLIGAPLFAKLRKALATAEALASKVPTGQNGASAEGEESATDVSMVQFSSPAPLVPNEINYTIDVEARDSGY